MLIRFHSKADAFTIQGDIGIALLRLMGMSGAVPGALLAQDVPPALERLKAAVAGVKPAAPAAAAGAAEGRGRGRKAGAAARRRAGGRPPRQPFGARLSAGSAARERREA